MEKCEKEFREFVSILGDRIDLTAMHQRAVHECHVHGKAEACEEEIRLISSLRYPSKDVDKVITDFIKCLSRG